jgi:hypothetical protein
VKPYEASEAETNIFVSISEPIKVGHEVSKHSKHSLSELKFSITFLESKQQAPPPHKIHKIYVDNILINVEKLLKRESQKYTCIFL